jgi:hypothetical protein
MRLKPIEYITLALYVIAFRAVDKIGEYKQRKVKEKWNNYDCQLKQKIKQ